VWSTLNHPNVAGFIGICYEQVGAYSVPCLVSHFYEQKTLKDNLDGILEGQRVKFVRVLSLIRSDLYLSAVWTVLPTSLRTGIFA
jgi:hypothetical protein